MEKNNLSSSKLQGETRINPSEELEVQQELFENIAFSGGGAKGAALVGALKQLEERGVRDNIKNVAGSSAGAMMSAFLSVGAEIADLEKISRENSLDSLFKNRFSGGYIVNKDTIALQKMLEKVIHNSLAKNLDNIRQQHQEQLKQVREEVKQVNSGEKTLSTKSRIALIEKSAQLETFNIAEFIYKVSNKAPITFRDLHHLQVINPEKYKNLLVTAVDKKRGELTIFSSQNTPDVDIATACRASCSLPILFEPVKIDINGEEREFIDGGYHNNVPQDLFYEDIGIDEMGSANEVKEAKFNGRTMAFVFASSSNLKNSVNVAVYSSREQITVPGKIERFFKNVILKKLSGTGGDFRYTDSNEQTHQFIRDNAPHSFILDTNIKTTEFAKASTKIELLYVNGEISTSRQFNNLGIEPEDLDLNQKEFIYEVLESIFNDKRLSKHKKIGHVNELVEFCKKDVWQGKSHQEVLKEFTVKAVDMSPHYAKHIITNLNKQDLNQEVKRDYLKILGEGKNIQKMAVPDQHQFSQAQLNEKFFFDRSNRENLGRNIIAIAKYIVSRIGRIVKSVTKKFIRSAGGVIGSSVSTSPEATSSVKAEDWQSAEIQGKAKSKKTKQKITSKLIEQAGDIKKKRKQYIAKHREDSSKVKIIKKQKNNQVRGK